MQQILTAIKNNEITHELLEGLTDYGKALIAFPLMELILLIYPKVFEKKPIPIMDFSESSSAMEYLSLDISDLAEMHGFNSTVADTFICKEYKKKLRYDSEFIYRPPELSNLVRLINLIPFQVVNKEDKISLEFLTVMPQLLKLQGIYDGFNFCKKIAVHSPEYNNILNEKILPAILEIANHHHKAKEHYLLKIAELLKDRQHLITHAVHHQQSNLDHALF